MQFWAEKMGRKGAEDDVQCASSGEVPRAFVVLVKVFFKYQIMIMKLV